MFSVADQYEAKTIQKTNLMNESYGCSSVKRHALKVGLFLLMSLTVAVLPAQNIEIEPKTNSPYSRFGLGDFVEQYYAAAAGMAGLSAAFNDPYHLNILNPASLTQLQATAFEVGINARYANLNSGDESTGVWTGNLTYLALGFPLINPINEVLDRKRSDIKLGMAFSLQPYSNVGYDIETSNEMPEIGQVSNFLKGSGGTYRVNWSNGFSFKSVAVGLNLGYHFGKLTNSRRVEFDSLSNAYISEFLDEVSMRGLVWSAGLQYTYKFKELNKKGELEATGKQLVVGLYGNSETGFNTNRTRFVERYNFVFNNQDTIISQEEVEEQGTLPSAFTLGVEYHSTNKLRLGAEVGLQNWSQYVNEAQPDTGLEDAWAFRLGGEYIPNYLSYNNYLERIRYRLGVLYQQDPRTFSGEQLVQYGITFGMGFPIILPRQRTSFVNFSVEAGRFGIAESLTEDYIRMTLGFTLNDNTWFFKRKFN
jgi:hypothetical protein